MSELQDIKAIKRSVVQPISHAEVYFQIPITGTLYIYSTIQRHGNRTTRKKGMEKENEWIVNKEILTNAPNAVNKEMLTKPM